MKLADEQITKASFDDENSMNDNKKPQVPLKIAEKMVDRPHNDDSVICVGDDSNLIREAVRKGWKNIQVSRIPDDEHNRLRTLYSVNIFTINDDNREMDKVLNPPYNNNVYIDYLSKAVKVLQKNCRLASINPRNFATEKDGIKLRKDILEIAGDSLQIEIISKVPEWSSTKSEVMIIKFRNMGFKATEYTLIDEFGQSKQTINGSNAWHLSNGVSQNTIQKAKELVNKHGAIELFDPGEVEDSAESVLCLRYVEKKKAFALRRLPADQKPEIVRDTGRGVMIINEMCKMQHNKKTKLFFLRAKERGKTHVCLFLGFCGRVVTPSPMEGEDIPFQKFVWKSEIDRCSPLDMGKGRVFLVATTDVDKFLWFVCHQRIRDLMVIYHHNNRATKSLSGIIPDMVELLSNDVDKREVQMKEWFE